MGNADRMIERNRRVSQEMAARVCKEIDRMVENHERISVQDLAHRTEVSRGFLYKNPVVSERLQKARVLQMDRQFIPEQKVILDRAMEKTMELQKKKIAAQEEELKTLRMENSKLKEALGKKDLKRLL